MGDSRLQRFISPQLHFEFRHPRRRQQFVQPPGKLAIGPGHGVRSSVVVMKKEGNATVDA
jgi:hypothetical protein